VLLKAGLLATIALIETPQTHEDACSITKELAGKLKTKLTKVKKVRSLHDLIKLKVKLGIK
jgi:hypothetical protein